MSSTTGTAIMSYLRAIAAASSRSSVASTVKGSSTMSSLIGVSGGQVTSLLRGTTPRSLRSSSVTYT